MSITRIVVNTKDRLLLTALHHLVDMHNQLGESTGKVVDEFVRQTAQARLDSVGKLAVMVLLVADGTEQVANADAVVLSELVQIW